ncbi:MAG: hypothetical protein R3B45_07135 [Bdellovibrionota bacterium]
MQISIIFDRNKMSSRNSDKKIDSGARGLVLKPHCFYNLLTYCLMASMLLTSCGPQTSLSGSSDKRNTKSETVAEDADTSLEITDGEAAGTAIDIPVGALAIGSEVSVSAVDTPSDFQIADISQASSSVSVDAKGPDGSTITSLESPMTISIPFSDGASLYALVGVEKNSDNLCALMKGNAGLFVWRRSAITIENSKAKFRSKNLGVFQLVYCGQEEMAGFNDAMESGASGIPDAIALTVDSSVYGFGGDHYCLALLSFDPNNHENDGNDGPEIILAADKNSIDGSKVNFSLSYFIDDIPDGYSAMLALLIQDETQGCDQSFIGKDVDDIDIGFKRVFVFEYTKTQLSSGTIGGTFGADSLALGSFKLKIGAPAGSPVQGIAPIAKNGCVEIDGGAGFSDSMISIAADGTINGGTEFEVLHPKGDGGVLSVKIRLGESCDDSDSQTNTSSGTASSFEPYEVRFENVAFGSLQYLFPLTLNTTNGGAVGTTACLRVYNGNGITASGANDDPLTNYNIQIGSSYQAYLPWNETKMDTSGTPLYDMHLQLGGDCYSSGSSGLSQDMLDKPLNNTISF